MIKFIQPCDHIEFKFKVINNQADLEKEFGAPTDDWIHIPISRSNAKEMMYDLQGEVDAVCPNYGCYIGDFTDKSTWGFHPAEDATPQQIAAGNAAIANFIFPKPPKPAIPKPPDIHTRVLDL